MTDNDLTDLALNADFRIIFCQSLDDEMVVVENVPDIFKSLRVSSANSFYIFFFSLHSLGSLAQSNVSVLHLIFELFIFLFVNKSIFI